MRSGAKMNRGSRAVTVSEVQVMAEIKVMKKQALRTAPKLTNVYTAVYIPSHSAQMGRKK